MLGEQQLSKGVNMVHLLKCNTEYENFIINSL